MRAVSSNNNNNNCERERVRKKIIEIRFDRKVSPNWNVIWNLCFYQNNPTLVCECVLCGARIWNIVNRKTSIALYGFLFLLCFDFFYSLHVIAMNVQDLWCHRPFTYIYNTFSINSNETFVMESILLCFFVIFRRIQHPNSHFYLHQYFLFCFVCSISFIQFLIASFCSVKFAMGNRLSNDSVH